MVKLQEQKSVADVIAQKSAPIVQSASDRSEGGILVAYESRWRIKNGNVRFA